MGIENKDDVKAFKCSVTKFLESNNNNIVLKNKKIYE